MIERPKLGSGKGGLNVHMWVIESGYRWGPYEISGSASAS